MATPTNNLKNLLYKYLISSPTQIYFGIGNTTPWTDESNPNQEQPTSNSIQDIQYYIQATKAVPVKALDNTSKDADLTFQGASYSILAQSDLTTSNIPDAVYFNTVFDNTATAENIALNDGFRQYGLFLGLSATEYKTVLKPSEIASNGTMIEYSNISPIYPQDNSQVTLSFIVPIEFLIA